MHSTSAQRTRVASLPVLVRSIRSSERWIYFFLAVQFGCQCALMAEWLGGRWRLYFRAASFASSLFMLFFIQGRPVQPHPARLLGVSLLGLMGLGLLHSDSDTVAGIAHWIFNIAIWAPLFWVGRITVTAKTVWNLLMMFWGFNLVSSVVGVLQVYYPERFAPSAEFVKSLLGIMADALLIELADGRQVWRPFGLSDNPGGASVAGSMTVIIGLAIFTMRSNRWLKTLAVLGISTGVFCIYICEIRSIMVTTVLGAGVMLMLQVLQGRTSRAFATMLIVPLVIVLGLSWTNALSDNRVQRRVQSLGEASTTAVYYQNRGRFIEYSLLEELPQYPLGAGLGRYGMMAAYFSDPTNTRRTILWAEVQLSAWLYDGGLLMIVLGYGAVIVACVSTYRIAVSRNLPPLLCECAGIITALNAGWLAITFTYVLFLSQSGLIFWMLNAAVFAAAAPIRLATARRTNRRQAQLRTL